NFYKRSPREGVCMTTARSVSWNSVHFRIAALVLLLAAIGTTASAQTYTDLHNFSSNSGPNDPFFSVIAQGRDGNMYTTSSQGFTGRQGDVFKITPEGHVTSLHHFTGPDG